MRLRMCEPLYGFPTNAPAQEFVKVKGTHDLFYTNDEELDVNKLLSEPLPPPAIAVNVVPHWLAIVGVQPLIPDNPSLDAQTYAATASVRAETLAKAKTKRHASGGHSVTGGKDADADAGDEGGDKDSKGASDKFAPVVQHVLSKELQIYFDRITALLRGGGGVNYEEQNLLNAAIGSLQTDAGLANLIPYYAKFISTEVQTNLRNLRKLLAMTRATAALVLNPNVNLELYLHQLMPSVLTCIVAKRLSENQGENHWQLRVLASKTVVEICEKYGNEYVTLQPRVTATLQKGLKASKSPLPTIFGALVGLSSLGPRVIESCVSSELDHIVQRAEDILSSSTSSEKPTSSDGGIEEKAYERTCAEKVLEAVQLVTDVLHEKEANEKLAEVKKNAMQSRVARLLEDTRQKKRAEAEKAIRNPLPYGKLPPIVTEKETRIEEEKEDSKAAVKESAAAETRKRKSKSEAPPEEPEPTMRGGRSTRRRAAAATVKKEEEIPPPTKRTRRR